ncbi:MULTISPECIES: helix-turn-helix domain-containing protein [unclassified Paenibacillus]|uniref:helix-turn-helix domain-containing protein n=1 Tax=unclassified Paenibacillus TaxID=185978 RepID=UPI00115FFF0A|nr:MULTISPECIES: helix-turn-helix domain-containing protein [unclassified Paenibacillus]
MRKSFYIILLLTCIPSLLTGMFVYVFGTSQIEREINSIHVNQLQRAVQGIDRDLTDLELVSSQWTINPVLDGTLRAADPEVSFEQIHNLYKTLASMKGSNPMVDAIYLYIKKSGMLVSDLQGAKRLSEDERRRVEELLGQERDIYWVTGDERTPQLFSHARHLLVTQSPAGSQQRLGAIFLTIDEERLNQLVGTAQWSGDSPVLLLNGQGQPISYGHEGRGGVGGLGEREGHGGNEGHGGREGLEASLQQAVMNKEGSSGTYLTDWKQESYSVSYSRFSRLGETWTYITATPLSGLTAPVVTLSRIIAAIGLTVLGLSLIISWLASRHLYRPLHRLLERLNATFRNVELEDGDGGKDEFDWLEKQWTSVTRESRLLQTRLEESLPLQREGFFLQLVQGHLYSLTESELRQRMSLLGWETHERCFSVSVFYLSGFPELSERFSEGDEPLVTFAAANVINEVARRRFDQAHVIHFQDLHVGLVAAAPGQREQLRSVVLATIREAMDALTQTLRLQVTVSLGKSADRADRIAEAMEEALHALRYRNMNESQQILDMEEWIAHGDSRFEYPFDEEKAIVQAFKMGLAEETTALLEPFMLRLERQSARQLHVQQGMTQLLGNLHHAILQAGFDPSELYEGANHYVELSELKDADKMKKWFAHRVIEPYIQVYLSSQQLHMKQLAEQIIRYLEQSYARDISLEQCADKLGTYPKKINQAIKLATGMTFVDYLTSFRMEKAKRFLVETDEKINDIAEKVGYQPSYFNRLFKRQEGVTPGQYRERRERG